MATTAMTPASGSVRDPFYDLPEWRALAARVRERDGNRCTVGWLLGGECSGPLHVNHVIPRREAPHRALDPDNCGSACASHHPMWEALRRALVERRETARPRCHHEHRYPGAREACERRLARKRGLVLA